MKRPEASIHSFGSDETDIASFPSAFGSYATYAAVIPSSDARMLRSMPTVFARSPNSPDSCVAAIERASRIAASFDSPTRAAT